MTLFNIYIICWIGHKEGMKDSKLLVKGFTLTAAWAFIWMCYWLRIDSFHSPFDGLQRKQAVVGIISPFENSNLTLEDICITVKTSKKFHDSRLILGLKTWHKMAKDLVYYITDGEDLKYQQELGNRLVSSKCGSSHGKLDLCCKVVVEFETFMDLPGKRWWCRFDDDNYVNVARLLEYLRTLDSNKHVYIGRRSLGNFQTWYRGKTIFYQFGTGGAGVCVSRPLVENIKTWFGATMLPLTCLYIGASDDCVLGFVIRLQETKLTETFKLHSHLENLMNVRDLSKQISLSYGESNVVDVPHPKFNTSYDPTRMFSLHCHIHPKDELCK